MRAARTAALLAALAEVAPDALVIEAYPFGRRALRFELEPLVAAARARAPRPLVLCSLRDIIVAPTQSERQREIVARVRADFCTRRWYTATPMIASRQVFRSPPKSPTGSFTPDMSQHPSRAGGSAGATDEVLVSAGGGAGGGALLRAALAARRLGCQADARWRLLAGPNLPPAEFAALAATAPAGVAVERYRADFTALLQSCRVSVSQAGYNTVMDVLAARTPAVLVPFADMRETEQSLRAELLAARGVVEVLPPAALSPQTLAEAIARAVSRPPALLGIDLSGSTQTAREIARMLATQNRA